MDKDENKQYEGRAAVLYCRVASPAAALPHSVFNFFWHVLNGQDNKPDSRALHCHCFRWSNFGTSIILFFCAEVSAAVFENESLFSNFPVFLFYIFFFLFSS